MKKAHDLIATVLGIGRIGIAPGTWGSLAGLALCLALHENLAIYLIAFVVFFIAGVVSSGKVEAEIGYKDPSIVVIDEFASIFLVFLFVPIKAFTILTGFILYRIMDIIKVPPMRSVERMGGGWGIMLDDLVAAIYTNLILQILLYLKIF